MDNRTIEQVRNNEDRLIKEQLQFVIDYEKEQIKVFEELEEAINEVDLSSETKEHLVGLMWKDVNILFGYVEGYFRY